MIHMYIYICIYVVNLTLNQTKISFKFQLKKVDSLKDFSLIM